MDKHSTKVGDDMGCTGSRAQVVRGDMESSLKSLSSVIVEKQVMGEQHCIVV